MMDLLFAFIGMPGHLELLIIGLICVMMIGVPAAIVIAVLLATRKR